MANFARNAVVLGLLALVGPFAIDMYLPALPAIGADLHAEPGMVQFSVLALFAAVGCFQIICGPLSDMFGRRRPLFVGMVLYTIGGIGCALAPSVEMLIAMRFLQGVGACAAMTIPRAGFSLAESGMKRPPLVFSSSATRLTRTRSLRGRIFIA